MVLSNGYKIINVADEYMAVPVGNNGNREVFILSNAAGYLLNTMQQSKTEEELVQLLIEEFDIEYMKAQTDVKKFVETMCQIGIIRR